MRQKMKLNKQNRKHGKNLDERYKKIIMEIKGNFRKQLNV
jgi:hypothetical protein